MFWVLHLHEIGLFMPHSSFFLLKWWFLPYISKIKEGCNWGHGLSGAIKLGSLVTDKPCHQLQPFLSKMHTPKKNYGKKSLNVPNVKLLSNFFQSFWTFNKINPWIKVTNYLCIFLLDIVFVCLFILLLSKAHLDFSKDSNI